jgi:hydroxymethylpyrimidine/phosphomethylpyrimidine kinase
MAEVSMTRVPVALTIAGSDSSGGAGIQADLKTFTALGVYGAAVVTALTAQNTQGVTGVLPVPADFVRAEIDAVASDLRIAAAKTGMLADAATVRAVADAVRAHALRPLIVDPVMIATSGDALISEDAIAVLRQELLPLAALLTPNLPEAARLLDAQLAADEAAAHAQAKALLALGPKAVLLKGGHGDGAGAVDLLATQDKVVRFERPRIATANTHGTGCTLSAAIVAHLALGTALPESVGLAKDFVWQALEAGRDLSVGAGHGPVDHLFALRRR